MKCRVETGKEIYLQVPVWSVIDRSVLQSRTDCSLQSASLDPPQITRNDKLGKAQEIIFLFLLAFIHPRYHWDRTNKVLLIRFVPQLFCPSPSPLSVSLQSQPVKLSQCHSASNCSSIWPFPPHGLNQAISCRC